MVWLVVATAGNHCGDPPFRQLQATPSLFTVPATLYFHSVSLPATQHVDIDLQRSRTASSGVLSHSRIIKLKRSNTREWVRSSTTCPHCVLYGCELHLSRLRQQELTK